MTPTTVLLYIALLLWTLLTYYIGFWEGEKKWETIFKGEISAKDLIKKLERKKGIDAIKRTAKKLDECGER